MEGPSASLAATVAPTNPEEELPALRPRMLWVGEASWQLHNPSHAGIVTEAYADAPSYLPGDTVRLAVSTTASRFTVAVFRLGPDMAQMSAESPSQPGGQQPPAVLSDASSLEVRAPWHFNYSQAIPGSWPSGIYLARVTGIGGADAYAEFVVRSTHPSQVLFVENAVNDQGYNEWGGTSFYVSSRGDLLPGIHHASAVSFDRPYDAENGAGQVFEHEAPLALWLERNKYDVTYTTDYDLAVRPESQPLPKVVVFAGHDEYWGRQLRDWLDLHVLERGDMNLGVFAANTGYYPVSFRDPSATGPRTVVVYKEAITNPDLGSRPANYPDGRRKLLRYRDLPWGDPGPDSLPEQKLLGVEYGFIATNFSPYRLAPGLPAFLLAGTGLKPGDSIGKLVGGEVDYVQPDLPIGQGDSVVAEARGFITRYGQPGIAQAVLRQLPSGGRVFSAGTFHWEWGLDSGYARTLAVPKGFQRLTRNIVDFLVNAGAQ